MRKIIVIMSGAALALLGVLPASAATSSYPGKNGLIAFSRSGQIYTISPSGSGLKQLTSAGDNYDPVWNPSGTQIAYEDQAPAGASNIWVMNANGSDQRQWTTTGQTYGTPAWSPDGATLLLTNGGSFGLLETTSGTTPEQPLTVLSGYNEDNGPAPPYGQLSGNNPAWTAGHITFVGSNYQEKGNGVECDYPAGSGTFGEDCIEVYQTGSQQYSHIATSGCGLNGSNADYLNVGWPRFYPTQADVVFQHYNEKAGAQSCQPHTPWQVTDQHGLGAVAHTKSGDQQADFSPDGTEMVVMNNLNSTSTSHIVVISSSGARRTIATGYQPSWQP